MRHLAVRLTSWPTTGRQQLPHCYDTGGMRRVHLRGRENVLKRQLIHVGAFNLSLILRTMLGAGTPRELISRSRSWLQRRRS
jgi:hypothetical protein